MVTAIILEKARLLRIDREDFFDLLADCTQITQGNLTWTNQNQKLTGFTG